MSHLEDEAPRPAKQHVRLRKQQIVQVREMRARMTTTAAIPAMAPVDRPPPPPLDKSLSLDGELGGEEGGPS